MASRMDGRLEDIIDGGDGTGPAVASTLERLKSLKLESSKKNERAARKAIRTRDDIWGTLLRPLLRREIKDGLLGKQMRAVQ
jgi:hypothetical protein